MIYRYVHFEYPENLTIGNNVGINRGSWINAMGGIEIEDDVIIGPKVVIHSADHKIWNPEELIRTSGMDFKPTKIKRGALITAGVIITPGVTIGKGAVIAAGAVVTNNVPDQAIAAGVPAKVIGYRDKGFINKKPSK